MPRSPRRRVSEALQERRRRLAVVRFALLATTLVLSLGLIMIAAPLVESRALLQTAVVAPLLIGVYVVSESTRFVGIWGTATALSVVLGVFAMGHNEPGLLAAEVGIRCVLLVALMFWIAREMLREVRVSLDTILGGICLYLLIGYVYALVYVAILLVNPQALLSGGQAFDLSLHATHPFQTAPAIFYFSFTAFTTMGFGDITPATPLARYVTITEGMLGQLYPAIFIARLVSLNLIQSASPPPGD